MTKKGKEIKYVWRDSQRKGEDQRKYRWEI